jgi:uncharacterized BrkB/YihY/UPF0761 family membrane protein
MELIGWLATILIIVSFMQKDILILRKLSLLGAILWIAYGLISEAWSIVFLNSIICIIQLYWIAKNKLKPKKKS